MIERFVYFTSYITQAYKYILKIKSYEMKTFGLKAAHVMCLFYIGGCERGLTAVELGALCMEDKAAISKSLSELKRKGFITVDDDNGSKVYRTKYLITEEGARVHEKISRFIEETVEECGKGLDAVERAAFYRALDVVTTNLKMYYEGLESKDSEKGELSQVESCGDNND